MAAIETLATGITAARSLIELLAHIGNLKSKSRREMFQEHIVPIHETFQEVHFDYSSMMRELLKEVPIIKGDGSHLLGTLKVNLSGEDAETKIEDAKAKFAKRRLDLIDVRSWCRFNSQALFAHVTEKEERRYLWSVVNYLLVVFPESQPDNEMIDLYIDMLVDNGGDATFDTPSDRLLHAISDVTDGGSIHEIVNQSSNLLNHRCSDVIKQYVALKQALR